jgi:hypothetical protein
MPMNHRRLDRRDFNRLTAAALGGLAAGHTLGCRQQTAGPGGPPADQAPGGNAGGQAAAAELHLCRGLNDCKGQGADKQNDCRGMGTCATVQHHSCGGQNDCKGLGGCGETVGANACKGQGGCAVPLMDAAWETLRRRLEAQWKEKNLPFHPAPAKKEA